MIVGIGQRPAVRGAGRPDAALIGKQARRVRKYDRAIQALLLRKVIVQLGADLIAHVPGRRTGERQCVVVGQCLMPEVGSIVYSKSISSGDLAEAPGGNHVPRKSVSRLRVDDRALIHILAGAIRAEDDGFVEQRAEIPVQKRRCGHSGSQAADPRIGICVALEAE